jgi:hypothetical protein
MFFFLSLRESSRGTVEPSMLPPTPSTSSYLSWFTSSFCEYITEWDFSDRTALIRRLACVLAFILHIPLNIISILSWGISFFLFLRILMSLLNLVCVGVALWKLDVMSGERRFYSWMQVCSSLVLSPILKLI